MSYVKVRRAAAAVLLISAFSLLPVQAAGSAPRTRAPRDAGLSEKSGHWPSWAWHFLVDMLQKRGVEIDPAGGW